VKTTLDDKGQIVIPEHIQATDRLAPGDSFELERVGPGRYLLAKQTTANSRFVIVDGEDGLPIIRTRDGIISSRQIEALVGEDDTYEQAKGQALALLDRGFHLGGRIKATRDEWHER
jgi:bifunctional DNA-binding transcriptional regulator/antitoxin component of YhaV-PrlF toxin-antitoxin module